MAEEEARATGDVAASALDYATPRDFPSRGRMILSGVVLVLWGILDMVGGLLVLLAAMAVAKFIPAVSFLMMVAGLLLFSWSMYTFSFAVGLMRELPEAPDEAWRACRQAEMVSYVVALLAVLVAVIAGASSRSGDAFYALIPIGILAAVVLPSVTLTRILLRSLVRPGERAGAVPEVRSPS